MTWNDVFRHCWDGEKLLRQSPAWKLQGVCGKAVEKSREQRHQYEY